MKLRYGARNVGIGGLSILATFFVQATVGLSADPTTVHKQETVYERVLKSGRIRAVYVVDPPALIEERNRSKISGIFAEAIAATGKNLGLKIEWVGRVDWDSMIDGLLTDRYDIVVSGIWASSSRGRLVDFSIPLFYSPVGVYVRKDDSRFGNNLKAINAVGTRIATIAGEMSDVIAQLQFPEAQRIALPETAALTVKLGTVAAGKADVTFASWLTGYEFVKNHPGTVKNIAARRPLRVFGNAMMFRKGQGEFASMLNTALQELLDQGFIDELIDKYEPSPGVYYRVAYPYRRVRQ